MTEYDIDGQVGITIKQTFKKKYESNNNNNNNNNNEPDKEKEEEEQEEEEEEEQEEEEEEEKQEEEEGEEKEEEEEVLDEYSSSSSSSFSFCKENISNDKMEEEKIKTKTTVGEFDHDNNVHLLQDHIPQETDLENGFGVTIMQVNTVKKRNNVTYHQRLKNQINNNNNSNNIKTEKEGKYREVEYTKENNDRRIKKSRKKSISIDVGWLLELFDWFMYALKWLCKIFLITAVIGLIFFALYFIMQREQVKLYHTVDYVNADRCHRVECNFTHGLQKEVFDMRRLTVSMIGYMTNHTRTKVISATHFGIPLCYIMVRMEGNSIQKFFNAEIFSKSTTMETLGERSMFCPDKKLYRQRFVEIVLKYTSEYGNTMIGNYVNNTSYAIQQGIAVQSGDNLCKEKPADIYTH